MTWTTRQRSDFGGLRAVRCGTGPRVLLLHGVGLNADAFGAQIDALSQRFEVIAPDMPGHGETAVPPVEMGLQDYTDLVADAMEAPAAVIGHSMGALMTLDLALRHPSRVQGIVPLNAIFERDAAAAQAVKTRAAALDGSRPADPSATLRRWFADDPSPERDACARWLRAVSPAGYRMAYRAFAASDGPARADLRSLACPALFMTGAEEPNSTPQMSRAMAELAPKGRAIIVEDAAHMMPMTHAALVNAAILDFLSETAR